MPPNLKPFFVIFVFATADVAAVPKQKVKQIAKPRALIRFLLFKVSSLTVFK